MRGNISSELLMRGGGVRSYLLISEFGNWITGVCSPYDVSLCDWPYYVFG